MAFFAAAQFGYTAEMVMNFSDKNLSTPLHVAVSMGDVEVTTVCVSYCFLYPGLKSLLILEES